MMQIQEPDSLKVTMRPGRAEDAVQLGKICYAAFDSISSKHGYSCDFQSVEATVGAMRWLLSNPSIYSVVAESGGKVVGSNFLHEGGSVTGVGPITVDPAFQNRNTGKELMLNVIRRSNEKGAAGIRLVQAAYHTRSLSLYTKLGFEAREPLSNFQWAPIRKKIIGRTVRKADKSDLESCNMLCRKVHGHDRSAELADSIESGNALVVENGDTITGYSSGLVWFGHSVGESNEDIIALISNASTFGYPGILVPTRNFSLMQWLLDNGFRINQQMTLMTVGLYNEPGGAYLPSVLF